MALAIVLSRTQHPSPVIFEGGLTFPMLLTLMVSIVAFTLLYALVLKMRTSTLKMRSDIVKLREELEL